MNYSNSYEKFIEDEHLIDKLNKIGLTIIILLVIILICILISKLIMLTYNFIALVRFLKKQQNLKKRNLEPL